MSSLTRLPRELHKFANVNIIHNEDGYIIWRPGTGDNVEITHIRSFIHGGGTRLLKVMLAELKNDPPYCSVFGFTRTNNKKAHFFYMSCGFTITRIRGVYEEGNACIFSANYQDLCVKHGV